jgi:hypothetical protein
MWIDGKSKVFSEGDLCWLDSLRTVPLAAAIEGRYGMKHRAFYRSGE